MRRNKNWLQAYMQVSKHSEAPDYFHFWTGVSTIAGALRRQTWIEQGIFQWVPNFYVIFVAPPGIISKTTTMSLGMDMLREIPGIKFGPNALTWQRLVEALANSTISLNFEGEDILYSSLTFAAGEMGVLIDPTDREMVDLLVHLWDGRKEIFEKETKTQGGDTIINPWINIIGCCTPAWIQNNFPEYVISGGLASRCIFLYGDTKRRLIAYPSAEMPADWRYLRASLVDDLQDIADSFIGPCELTPEGLAWGTSWYEQHYERIKQVSSEDRIIGYLSRKQTHIHKLAIIICASEGNERLITDKHLAAASDIVTSTEDMLTKIFASVSAPGAKAANKIVSLITQAGKIRLSEAYQRLFQTVSYQDFKLGYEAAIKAGKIELLTEDDLQYLVVR